MDDGLTLHVSPQLVERIAQRTAEIIGVAPADSQRYLDFNGALDYLGWGRRGRSRLYSLTSTEAIPFVKHGQRLYFDRAELDTYIDSRRRGRR